jgi:hypothetical protein
VSRRYSPISVALSSGDDGTITVTFVGSTFERPSEILPQYAAGLVFVFATGDHFALFESSPEQIPPSMPYLPPNPARGFFVKPCYFL